MKQTVNIYFLAFASIFMITSCTEDDPDAVLVNYQEEYLGVWDCNEKTGTNAPQIYEVQITEGDSDTEIIISDLYNSGTSVIAEINGPSLSIASQTTNGVSISGTGTANADFQQISLNFTANQGFGDDNVEAVLLR